MDKAHKPSSSKCSMQLLHPYRTLSACFTFSLVTTVIHRRKLTNNVTNISLQTCGIQVTGKIQPRLNCPYHKDAWEWRQSSSTASSPLFWVTTNFLFNYAYIHCVKLTASVSMASITTALSHTKTVSTWYLETTFTLQLALPNSIEASHKGANFWLLSMCFTL
jgi:hypothetical protein